MNMTATLAKTCRNLLTVAQITVLTVGGLSAGTIAAIAQIKPASSGEPSFREPEMKPHGGGMYHPNERRHRLRDRHRRLSPAGRFRN